MLAEHWQEAMFAVGVAGLLGTFAYGVLAYFADRLMECIEGRVE